MASWTECARCRLRLLIANCQRQRTARSHCSLSSALSRTAYVPASTIRESVLRPRLRPGVARFSISAKVPRPNNEISAASLDDHVQEDDDYEEQTQRAHPLTVANRFRTFPSTLQVPKATVSDPLSEILAVTSPQHLSKAAHTIFGGEGLPWSMATSRYAKNKEQKPIPTSPLQAELSSSQTNAFLAAVFPGVFACVTSALVETRKRLGSSWLRDLMEKPGGPVVLDVGGAGASILAFRDLLRTEWELMHDLDNANVSADRIETDVPFGKASVVIANDILRQRASTMLDNTSFIPRLPDLAGADSERRRARYDLIVAPNTLWDLGEDYLRKQHIANLWSLLSDGGVLILLEKGVSKAFDTVANARQFLLDKKIGHNAVSADAAPREKGMIIAPCTNHVKCPMYDRHRTANSKRSCCHFEQRYIRPPFLQKLVGARDQNFEDVRFSYLSVMRGRDLNGSDIVQGDQATNRAFIGYEVPDMKSKESIDPTAPAITSDDLTTISTPHPLTLPRAVLPPLKRTGHVILDLCTPSGTLERWTVPRSFSKQAYRDARKSSWGDLWALGAKTRVNKDLKAGKTRNVKGANVPRSKAKNVVEVPLDGRGRVMADEMRVMSGGRMRQGKIRGIRDKRDRKGEKQRCHGS